MRRTSQIFIVLSIIFAGLIQVSCGGGLANPGKAAGDSSSTVSSVSASCNPTSVAAGETAQCTATVQGTGSYSEAVTWSAPTGSISTAGLYTAPDVATDTSIAIKAVSQTDTAKWGSTSVKVGGQVSVSISPTTVKLVSGGTQDFTAAVTGSSKGTVTWSATAGSISDKGAFTAPTATSNTNITVTATTHTHVSKSASAAVTVTPTGDLAISIAPTTTTVSSGETKQFAATVTGSTNTAVTWSASAGSISASGLFTAPTVTSNTTVNVKGTSQADTTKSASATVTVDTSASGTLLLLRDTVGSWTHRDYGKGTDVGSNSSGGGYLYDNPNVNGVQAMGMTVTPTAQASPAASSDSVYLWEPAYSWGYAGHDVWLRTSLYFPSQAFPNFNPAEVPYEATTGVFNWLLIWHTGTPNAGPSNVCLGIVSDYPLSTSTPGNNPRLLLRLDSGTKASPIELWINTAGETGSGSLKGPAIPRDQWIPILLHTYLDPTNGIVDWFVDGNLVYHADHVPTLWTPSDWVTLTFASYRYHVTFDSTVYRGPTAVGTTEASVMSAF